MMHSDVTDVYHIRQRLAVMGKLYTAWILVRALPAVWSERWPLLAVSAWSKYDWMMMMIMIMMRLVTAAISYVAVVSVMNTLQTADSALQKNAQLSTNT